MPISLSPSPTYAPNLDYRRPRKEAVARQRYASVGGRQTRDDPASGNTDTQGKRRGLSITTSINAESINAEDREIHLWIQSVTSLQQQRRFVDFRFFVNGLSIFGAAPLFCRGFWTPILGTKPVLCLSACLLEKR